MSQVEDEDVFIPPDGGYGWFVALGAFVAFFFSAGIVKSYGVIFDNILMEYKDATVSQAAWIPVSTSILAQIIFYFINSRRGS